MSLYSSTSCAQALPLAWRPTPGARACGGMSRRHTAPEGAHTGAGCSDSFGSPRPLLSTLGRGPGVSRGGRKALDAAVHA
eukprot:10598183-Heterocapsa_arctica.AAC.1